MEGDADLCRCRAHSGSGNADKPYFLQGVCASFCSCCSDKNTLTAQGKKGLFQEWYITPNPQKQHASQGYHVLSSLSWLPTLILLPQYILYHWFLKSEFRLGRARTEAE